GVHIGAISPPGILRRVDRADLVLNLGAMRTDMDLGSRPPQVTRDRTIWAVDGRVHVSFHTYTDVHIREFVRGLLRARLRRHREAVRSHDTRPRPTPRAGEPLEVTGVLHEVNRSLRAHPRHVVFAESGDMLFAGLDVRLGHASGYLAQGFYASMGFGVP